MNKITLDDIFKEDTDGLLESKMGSSSSRTEDERLIDSFLEINRFIDENKKSPDIGADTLKEHILASRLYSIRHSPEKVKVLRDFDQHELLSIEEKAYTSVNDILGDDETGLLDNDNQSVFKLTNIPRFEREITDFVARRKPIENFSIYEPVFKSIHEDIRNGKRELLNFTSEDQLVDGNFYIAGGILFLLEKVKITVRDHYKSDGTRVRRDGRTRCVFENGLYSNMLLRSVGKLLQLDGKVITNPGERLFDYKALDEDDNESGYIYILQSLSSRAELPRKDNLYKIGFSQTEVTDRIKNSEKESTYLMDKVKIVKVYKCFNLNPHKLEHLLHTFFGEAQLMIDIFDKEGKRHTPREWFLAPIDVIDKAIHMVISGEIVDYKYDNNSEQIVSLK